ncbi:conserved unknown protein [Ectocarpus siliculosus]|uniref:Uncharacterized protein n=1 Tax=Ectocarpus siliculosus TaxID=2880 RepID=D8LTA8_ECTSI|nr:conserved unknown protein [Ectocarpus siliculosus]|eukprot:CBN77979.1 conserved unknown protein [Ectocarpus siliculosus]
MPNAEAAELMKLVASTNSSVKLDLSAFSTAGEYVEASPVLGRDGFSGRSSNPFNEDAQPGLAQNGRGRPDKMQRWPSSGHQPAKMVVVDISSAENTPVTTPVHTPGGMGGGGMGRGSALPVSPPRPPSRVDTSRSSSAAAAAAGAPSLNPFVEERRSPSASPTNPFVTASSSLNPFAGGDDGERQAAESEKKGGGGGGGGWRTGGEEEAPPVVEEKAGAATAASPPPPPPPSGESNNPKKPPPLPPRRPASHTPTDQHPPQPSAATAGEGSGGHSGPASPRSTVSSATCDSSGGGGHGDGSEAGPGVGSADPSTGDDGIAGAKYLVVNKDTGKNFDVREMEQHLPTNNYTLLPSRKDLIERERRRSSDNPVPVTPTPPATDSSTEPSLSLAAAAGPAAGAAKPNSPSPRSSLSASVAASMSAAVGSTTSRKEKAKSLGSMMRRKLGKVKTASGASSPSRPSSSSFGGGGGGGVGDALVDVEGSGGAGGAGERSSVGSGMGAAAKAARGALAGIRVSFKGKEASETLTGLMLFQELRCHDGPIWTAAFNQSGEFLATAGQDARILLHRVGDTRDDLRGEKAGDGDSGGDGGSKAAAPDSASTGAEGSGRPRSEKGRPEPGTRGVESVDCGNGGDGTVSEDATTKGSGRPPLSGSVGGSGGGGGRGSDGRALSTVMIDPEPWQIWEAHKGDVVAISWSRNDFLLSASLDKTVRLWHTTQASCLHCFQHADTVTSVDFHPLLEHFFLSGCFDKKIRVWNIRDGRVQEWQQAPDMVTAAKFSLDGQMIVAGLYMGQVLFYQTEGMRYFTQIECRNRRGTKKRGCKVSGFAFRRTAFGGGDEAGGGKKDAGVDGSGAGGVGGSNRSAGSSPTTGRRSEPVTPSPAFGGPVGRGGEGGAAGGVGGVIAGGAGSHVPEQLLVTTNDSRLRLYNTDDFGMNAKYKGFANDTLQITATFSEDGKQIISGSENGKVYVWSTGVVAGTSPSTLPGVGGGGGGGRIPGVGASAAAATSPSPAVAPTQKDTNTRHESFHATSEAPKIVTTACFVPESTSRACVRAVRGGLSGPVEESGGYGGCMILATDYNGCVRVYCKSAVLLS